MPAEERIKKILAVTELILKLVLMILCLNLILTMAYAALSENGTGGTHTVLLSGFLVSADVFAVLLFLKVRLVPEPRKGVLKFISTRNVTLLFLLSGAAVGLLYFRSLLSLERRYPAFRDMPGILRSGIAAGRIVPESASDIVIHERMMTPVRIEWRCRLPERDFRNFADHGNWRPEAEPDIVPDQVFPRYCGEKRMPPRSLFFSKRNGNGGEISVMYDPETQTMYGQISSR